MTRTAETHAILHAAQAIKAKEKRDRKRARPPMVVKMEQTPRVRDKTYLAWIRRLPCVACAVAGKVTHGAQAAHCRMSIASAGWVNPGMQSKPSDYRCTPLCSTCHLIDQHGGAEKLFWDKLNIFPPVLCDALKQCYDAGQDGAVVIMSVAAIARRTMRGTVEGRT